jgi:hypothetical protein
MSHGYSDLQVVHDQPGLEYSPSAQGHNAVAQSDQNYTTNPSPLKYYDAPQTTDNSGGNAPPPDSKRICGLASRTFWVLAGVIGIVVVAAAVGGGVGGALASKSTHTESTTSTSSIQSAGSTQGASASSSSPSSSPSSPTNAVALSTSTITGGSPEITLLSDCPSSNNTLYTVNVGQDMSFRKVCGASYLNALNAGDVVNVRTLSLDDCIVECATYNIQNKTEIAAGQSNVCNAVCWRNTFTNDEFPGQCFGFTTQNSSSNFVVKSESICDSAAWIDQDF